MNFYGQFDGKEVGFWIDVLFARFVYDAEQAVRGGISIGQSSIDFTNIKCCGVVFAIDANYVC